MSEVIAGYFKDMRAGYGRRDAQSIDENLYFHHKSELQTAFVENQNGFLARIPIITQQFAIMTHRLNPFHAYPRPILLQIKVKNTYSRASFSESSPNLHVKNSPAPQKISPFALQFRHIVITLYLINDKGMSILIAAVAQSVEH